MRPFDDLAGLEPDYGDVALLVAGAREWPSEDFARELDARVARRFAPEAAPRASRDGRSRLPRWAAGSAAAVVAGVVAAVVVVTGQSTTGQLSHNGALNLPSAGNAVKERPQGFLQQSSTQASHGTPGGTSGGATGSATLGQALPPSASASESLPVAPGRKQIRSAQIVLTTPNQHVDQVASEVFTVVGTEHGSVLISHITTATSSSGGGYASFSLSIPTGNLQDAMTQLARLHYATLTSSTDGSQNVSNQYNNDQRQLSDARALRASLLKQLQSAYTTQAIDSIKAQLKLAEQQINTWQSTLNSLNHRISYSNLTVQVNAGVLPVGPVHHSSSFTIGRAAHDALRVLVVAAGVALIALAVALPLGLVVALLMWLWVWLRQRRREHALDATA